MEDRSDGRRRAEQRGSEHLAVLQRFIAEEAEGRRPDTARRYHRVLARLLQMLDTMDVAPHVGTGPAALLEVERDFGREGAFLRVLGLEELVCCLPAFVEAPWLPSAAGERRTHLSIVERLLRRLQREPGLDVQGVSCALLDARSAVRRARWAADRQAWPADEQTEPGAPRLRLVRGGLADDR